MSHISNTMKNDILSISYFLEKNNWESTNKVSFQRILYFSSVLSSVFLKDYPWVYDFSNTMFGPYNNEIADSISELHVKGYLNLVERNIYSNRTEESFSISDNGEKQCENIIFRLDSNKDKTKWFEIIVKTLSLYGESFLSKLVKEDPNVMNMKLTNSSGKIISDSTSNNVSREFFLYLKEQGLERVDLQEDDDVGVLLMFFDVLYQKYRGGI
ncbi:hypothetical protein FJO98_13370 [Enterococcus sp. PF-2]|uniref:hypothetical protein n=1 Tax=unclassified Enterococcus TaxID=2608891 RepID=UPI00112260F8|nr:MULTISPECIES: hypothetical protein [unclassified Enterococcus]TPE00967.1 hypothetical protein FJP08_13805 [Enterococcus sp. PF-3]TPE24519.1 hypothetical protein FJO98_13370 [Enterococcus sp. PF-2]